MKPNGHWTADVAVILAGARGRSETDILADIAGVFSNCQADALEAAADAVAEYQDKHEDGVQMQALEAIRNLKDTVGGEKESGR